MRLSVVFILFVITINSLIYDTASDDVNCGNTTNQRVSVEFASQIVQHEFIVQFKQYYQADERALLLKSAIGNEISNWTIIERSNPANAFPSDFDIVRLHENNTNREIELLNRLLQTHALIKSITPQRIVHRTLKYVDSDDNREDIEPEIKNENENDIIDYIAKHLKIDTKNKNECCVPEFQNFRRGLSSSDSNQQSNSGSSNANAHSNRRLLRAIPRQITSILKADALWSIGITGKGVKVAVFDTGLSKTHPHFKKIKERTNWTNEKSFSDGISHGTFVSGVIASSKECLGFAPDADLHIYRVFTNNQVSYTSWFLDAFNYAILKKVNVINLSIGGPDFLDRPFVDKVLELSANRIIMVSAIGNDGPLYGTLNNPGDQMDVIGVGGMNFDEKIAKFSSRGMTTWELPQGYGRLKPDIVTYGAQVKGSNLKGGCRSLSGTSVASPVVAGAVTLIISGVLKKMDFINPSSVKQALIEGAVRLNDNNMFEQGHGKLNILKSIKILSEYQPKVSLSPTHLDMTDDYMFPYSTQSIFYTMQPVIVNVTILNGVAVTGRVAEVQWYPYQNENGNLLNVSISYSDIIWPWSGWMSLQITVNEYGEKYEGQALGHISVTVESLSPNDSGERINSTVSFSIRCKIIPKPPRQKRIIWDQYHNLRYPPGYIPRDSLKVKSDPLDWRSDHIHTNFKDMYTHLRSKGYYIEVLGQPFTCFNASNYGTLLIVDPEEEYFDEEIVKFKADVWDKGLSVIIFGDWYNTTVMKHMKFYDQNTRQWWVPDTGGTNVPALNELLRDFDIALGDKVLEGYFNFAEQHDMYYNSGTGIIKFPKNNQTILIEIDLIDQGAEILKNSPSQKDIPEIALSSAKKKQKEVILGMTQTQRDKNGGRLVVYGDSNCLDSTHIEKACFWLIDALLEFTMTGHVSNILKKFNSAPFLEFTDKPRPQRMAGNNLHSYSKVLEPSDSKKKRPVTTCLKLHWESPYFLNITRTFISNLEAVETNNI